MTIQHATVIKTAGAARRSELFMVRSKIPSRHWSIKRYEIDMLRLERWCLKTIIDINQHGGIP